SGGLFRTTNGGASFAPIRGDLASPTGAAWLIHPTNPNLVLTTAYPLANDFGPPVSYSGIVRSINGGDAWSTVPNPDYPASNPLKQATALLFDPTSPSIAYAGVADSGPVRVFKSVDGGQTFAAVETGIPQNAPINDLAASVGEAVTLLAAVGPGGGSPGGVYRSGDGGATWEQKNNGLPGGFRGFALAVHPTSPATIYVGGQADWAPTKLFVSNDSGESWLPAATGLPPGAGVYELEIDPVTPSLMYAGVDGSGVYRSRDAGVTWNPFNQGLGSTRIWKLAVKPGDPRHVIAATSGGLWEIDAINADEVTAGSMQAPPGAAINVPLFVRDLAGTPLGGDAGAGNRIQSFAIKVGWSPASAVANVSIARAGIAASLTPLEETVSRTPTTISLAETFAEATDPLPLQLESPFPGDQVARVRVTLAAGVPLGTVVSLAIDTAGTRLANETGSTLETPALGTLIPYDGGIMVTGTPAANLAALALSASSVLLSWDDPNNSETGIRLERSPDGSAWATVATLGPTVTQHTDTGLDPATLYYYRAVTLYATGEAEPSNVAAATTFSAIPARVCRTQVGPSYPPYGAATVAFNGAQWATVYVEGSDVLFQLLNAATGAPTGPPVVLTETDVGVGRPTIVWNGSQFGVLLMRVGRGPDGAYANQAFFALLDGSGQRLRADVLVPEPGGTTSILGRNGELPLVWDGTAWGVFVSNPAASPTIDWFYYRLDADGDRIVGPVNLHGSPRQESDLEAAWNGSEYGLLWTYYEVATAELRFQRMQVDGTLVGAPITLAATPLPANDFFGTSIIWDGSSWVAAWSVGANGGTRPVYLQKLDGAGNPLGTASRLSDDFDSQSPPGDPKFVVDRTPKLLRASGGGYMVFTTSQPLPGRQDEIGLLRADAGGARLTARALLTASDGRPSTDPRVAASGVGFLVAYLDNALGWPERAALVVNAAGAVTAGPTPLSTGHGKGGTVPAAVVALAGGFAALWTDNISGGNRIYAQIRDASGAVTAERSPLSPFPVNGVPAAAAVGDSFAVGWKDGGNFYRFARYDGSGNPLIDEIVLAPGNQSASSPALAFNGETYGMAWTVGGNITFQAVAADGSPAGAAVGVAGSPGANPQPQLVWAGTRWALAWTGGDSVLNVAFLDRSGAMLVAPVALASSATGRPLAAWTGTHLALAWTDKRDGKNFIDLYYTLVDTSGTKVFAERAVVTGDDIEAPLFLYPAGGMTHLLYAPSLRGVEEIDIQGDGSVSGPARVFSNQRTTQLAAAFDGATIGALWSYGPLFFQTSACLDDTTPPTCPTLATSFAGNAVALQWGLGGDLESTVVDQYLYRDGGLLAQLLPATTTFSDGGWVAGTGHRYEVRSMNGSHLESAGCSAQPAGCTLTCLANVPAVVPAGLPATLQSTATVDPTCSGSVAAEWDFGDGSPYGTTAAEQHVYLTPGQYRWTSTASLPGVVCAQGGVVNVCGLECTAIAPVEALAGLAAPFLATATASFCGAGAVAFDWDFGDQTLHSLLPNPSHIYAAAGTFTWRLTATVNGQSCSRTGQITVAGPACSGAYDLIIPAAAHANNQWQSDVDLVNLAETPASVDIALLKANQANLNPIARNFAVPGGQSRRIPDILASLLPAPGGALGIRFCSGQAKVNSRFYNTASRCGGTYGMLVPAMAPAAALTNVRGGVMHHFTSSPDTRIGFRVNIGFASAVAFNTTVVVRLFGDDGALLGTTTQNLRPFEHRQLTRVHQPLGNPQVAHGWAIAEVTTPGGIVHVYSMLIDNVSSDPIYMPAELE
ncbi:MAG: PKD domain-containing protein, partial [Acidobacteriota bacterium]